MLRRGGTVLELLVVVAIICTLLAFSVTVYVTSLVRCKQRLGALQVKRMEAMLEASIE